MLDIFIFLENYIKTFRWKKLLVVQKIIFLYPKIYTLIIKNPIFCYISSRLLEWRFEKPHKYVEFNMSINSPSILLTKTLSNTLILQYTKYLDTNHVSYSQFTPAVHPLEFIFLPYEYTNSIIEITSYTANKREFTQHTVKTAILKLRYDLHPENPVKTQLFVRIYKLDRAWHAPKHFNRLPQHLRYIASKYPPYILYSFYLFIYLTLYSITIIYLYYILPYFQFFIWSWDLDYRDIPYWWIFLEFTLICYDFIAFDWIVDSPLIYWFSNMTSESLCCDLIDTLG